MVVREHQRLFQIGVVARAQKAQRRRQREAVLGVELLVHAVNHLVQLVDAIRCIAHQAGQVAEQLVHVVAQAAREHALFHLLARLAHRRADLLELHALDDLRAVAAEHRAQRLELGDALLELFLLALHAHQHVLDHRVVLAAQAAQLEQLLDDVAATHLQQLLRACRHVLHRQLHLLGDDLATLRNQLIRQHRLQLEQSALRQQLMVMADLGHQALLRRHRIHALDIDIEHLCRRHDLATDFVFDFLCGLERIPQAIDLVEHRDAALALATTDMRAPQLQVALGHAGVRGQHEHHDMRIRNQSQRQLRLGTDGVQARRVQDHQALLEHRVREIDDRVTPLRHFDRAGGIHRERGVGIGVVIEPQLFGFFLRHAHGFHHVAERFEHALGRRRVERDRQPVAPRIAKIGRRCVVQTRLDRQQTDRRRIAFVVHQLGRTHRGPARRRRQDAAAEIRKEDRVDQFTLAARELGNEGDLELVAAQHAPDALRAHVSLRVVQLLGLQPVLEFPHRLQYRSAPGAVLLELCAQCVVHRSVLFCARPDSGKMRAPLDIAVTAQLRHRNAQI